MLRKIYSKVMIENKLMNIFSELPLLQAASRWIIAYSGGVDSQVLLQLSTQTALINNKKLLAVHINHGINPYADAWAVHCKTVCKALGINFFAVKVVVNQVNGDSLEAAAREARYTALANFMQANDVLLTAHHQDDQAETLLLQLLRGTGIKGLASMPQVSHFSQGYLVRPLLTTSHAEILAYARKNNLQWIDDDSNINQRFERNFLRQTILPLLKERWPAVSTLLARTARHCADADILLMKTGRKDYRAASKVKPLNVPKFLHTGIINRLTITPLLTLPFIRRINAIRAWLYDLSIPTAKGVTEKILQHILHDILLSRDDANPLIILGDLELRRFRNEIIISHPLAELDSQQIHSWDLCSELTLSIGKLTPDLVNQSKIKLSASKFTVRFRQGGERFYSAHFTHSKSLKKLFQIWAVPPWLRGRLPLLYDDNRLIAVLGYAHE